MLSVYPAVFLGSEEEGGYCVIIPDLNYCGTQGDTIEEAMFMAMDCIAGHLMLLKEDGEEIPSPSPIERIDVQAICDYLEIEEGKHFVTLVSVDAEEHAKKYFEKPVKKI